MVLQGSALSTQFRGRLVMFGRRHLRDRAAAEDLAQETLRRVLEAGAAGKIQNPAALPGFVHETARHVVQQHYRRRQREHRAFGKLEREETDDSMNPLDDLISEQRRAEVRRALERLQHADRALLHWVYHEGVDGAEAAARLGVVQGTLRVRKHRALQRLAALL